MTVGRRKFLKPIYEALLATEGGKVQVEKSDKGDRVVIPFNVSCGTCFTCGQGLHSQCETTQVHEYGTGASLFGYTKLYGQVPGGQAEYLRVPFGNTLPIKVPDGPPDDRFVFLSDVLPTAWQAVVYADAPPGGFGGRGPIPSPTPISLMGLSEAWATGTSTPRPEASSRNAANRKPTVANAKVTVWSALTALPTAAKRPFIAAPIADVMWS